MRTFDSSPKQKQSPAGARNQKKANLSFRSLSLHQTKSASEDLNEDTAFPDLNYRFNPIKPNCSLPIGIANNLVVDSVDSPYERTANQMATEVLRMPDPKTHHSNKKLESGGILNSMQANTKSSTTTPLDKEIESRIHGKVRNGGRPLSRSEKSFFEPRFNQDFSQVRVHQAEKESDELNADAYCIGQHIMLGTSENDRDVLGHELAHVSINQRMARNNQASLISRKPKDDNICNINPEWEDEQNANMRALAFSDCVKREGKEKEVNCYEGVFNKPPPPDMHVYSTPIPQGSLYNKDGSVTLSKNDLDITIMPDKFSEEKGGEENQGMTQANVDINYFIDSDAKKLRTPIKTFRKRIALRIQTSYYEGQTGTKDSAYGRGATNDDISHGNRSLRFHEGQHGQDYIEFLTTMLPRFTYNPIGKTEEQLLLQLGNYRNEIVKAMKDFSVKRTDCAGGAEKKTIDDIKKDKSKTYCSP